jgi:acylphosphatase
MKTMRIKVFGRVQGVFYRQSTQEKAHQLHLKGTVRNCEDDTVEIVATGNEEELNQLIAWCRKGPPRAKVTEVSTQELSLQQFYNFSIIRY